MSTPIEDDFTDVIGKAKRGLGLNDSDLAKRAGLALGDIHYVCAGHFDSAVVSRLAPVLGLKPQALLGLPKYHPSPVAVPGLAAFSTSVNGMLVNAYVVWDPSTGKAAAFDTGADAGPILDFLHSRNLALRYILLTHTHYDHVNDLDRLHASTGARAFVGNREQLPGAEPFEEGHEFRLGALRIETRLTWGHSRGGMTYVIHGLELPVAVVGDAVFAGSMGGGAVSYKDAIQTNREKIMSLPPETVLCPGHGPMTTVGEERVNNPFLAE